MCAVWNFILFFIFDISLKSKYTLVFQIKLQFNYISKRLDNLGLVNFINNSKIYHYENHKTITNH